MSSESNILNNNNNNERHSLLEVMFSSQETQDVIKVARRKRFLLMYANTGSVINQN